jgi:hypothetical protein
VARSVVSHPLVLKGLHRGVAVDHRVQLSIPRPPRSAAIPLTMTYLLLVVLCLEVTSFREIRIAFIRPGGSGALPIVHRGQEFVVEGIVDRGNNVYREVKSVGVYLFAPSRDALGGEIRRDSNRAEFDRVSCRFSSRLRVNQDENTGVLFVRLSLSDRLERPYGPGARSLGGNELKVRVE